MSTVNADTTGDFPNLRTIEVPPAIFLPYVRVGRFSEGEPELMAGHTIQNKTYATYGGYTGLVVWPATVAVLKRYGKMPKWGPLRVGLFSPIFGLLGALGGWQYGIVEQSRELQRLSPDASFEQIVDKMSLFQEIVLYAREPNTARPPLRASTTGVKRPSDFSGQDAITAQYRAASPLKQDGAAPEEAKQEETKKSWGWGK